MANDFFLKNAQAAGRVRTGRQSSSAISSVATWAGPSKKDKLFFFANYEGQRQAESAIVQRTAPTASYQQGMLQYKDANGGNVFAEPGPGHGALDAANGCDVCGTAAYPAGPGTKSECAGVSSTTYPAANGTQLGDGAQHRIVHVFIAAPRHAEHDNREVRLGSLGQAPPVCARQPAEGHDRQEWSSSRARAPSSVLIDNSKGMTFGDTWTISPKPGQ